MSSLHETAYPRLNAEITERELLTLFTPTPAEIAFVSERYRQAPTRAMLLILLKLLQRLGNFIPATEIPAPIIEHVCNHLGVRPILKRAVVKYEQSGSKWLHQKFLRTYVDIRQFEVTDHEWMDGIALQAAHTKQELSDIINVMIEELAHHRFELPSFAFLLRVATRMRKTYNDQVYKRLAGELSEEQRFRIDELLSHRGARTRWDRLKREPKQPGVREIASFLQHIQDLTMLGEGLPAGDFLSVPKRTQLVTEARALDISEMLELKPAKRYSLTVLLIQAQLQKAMDDIAEIFVKAVRNMHHVAEDRLREYRLQHAEQTERLISQFRDVLTALQNEAPDKERLALIEQVLDGDPEPWIIRCDEHMAYAGNNYYPFILQPYRAKRALLFQCLDVLALKSSSQDESLLRALQWMRQFRSSHREYVLVNADELDIASLDWISEKWQRLIVGKEQPSGADKIIHRKYFELCVFSQIMQELKSGDVYVEHSDQYDDYRVHLISWEECRKEIMNYGKLVDLPMDSEKFVDKLRDDLSEIARQVDERFPDNEHVDFSESGLIIRRTERQQPPPNLEVIDQAITEHMEPASILDILTETEQWLDLHSIFGPLSGFESKIDDPRKRFISTLFCYGCNLGPTQTARSLKGLSRKQVAWLNLRHVTEERLEKALVKVINSYNRFALPRYWGTGKSVSADGTKWNVYEQNLLSEYHIRYGGYGGIGYYHVSDMYIALFSHFIPCGVYEAVHILDGLIKNESDVQPDTVHGDTQAQSAPVFGLAYLLGINLMPRIRNIKELTFFRPDKQEQYPHINGLFRGNIDWELIELHYPDMLRVAISIKAGKITPSMILRRLGTYSRKNKLYFAFRELGRVIRTQFLLKYINDVELRRTIHAATNKSEEFNNFTKWLFFGGDGIIAENIRHEQRKVIKYNHLVANMVILNNVQWMSRKLKDMQSKGYPVDEDVLKGLSPYRFSHINRYGDYTLDLNKKGAPIDYKIDFRRH
ncbi:MULTISPECIES: Tn3 family transposase [Undibacterium]|uniref:Tn3 family transposase n=2 Tax=Undibacterium TaxID=401469 RepID=A0ABR6YJM5_9BURK|nr:MULTISPECIES: Tn3 family transposase [Undibacterium]MBC3884106.1 Tn3 family transposase [Undibacterium griseum]MBR7792163.1 Tn3 family transposase [Undibacterium rivi]